MQQPVRFRKAQELRSQDDDYTMKGNIWRKGGSVRWSHGIILAKISLEMDLCSACKCKSSWVSWKKVAYKYHNKLNIWQQYFQKRTWGSKFLLAWIVTDNISIPFVQAFHWFVFQTENDLRSLERSYFYSSDVPKDNQEIKTSALVDDKWDYEKCVVAKQ